TGNDMGIGQQLNHMLGDVDTISPMMYPSHYNLGEYGIKNPNTQPYDTIHRGIHDTKRVLAKSTVELRPWLQDFSLGGVKYTAPMVRAQIDAAADQGIYEWLLWNPSCHYTSDALDPN